MADPADLMDNVLKALSGLSPDPEAYMRKVKEEERARDKLRKKIREHACDAIRFLADAARSEHLLKEYLDDAMVQVMAAMQLAKQLEG